MASGRKIALAVLVQPTGYHAASWLHPSTALDSATSIDWYRDAALTAERGLFDLFFIADTPAARTSQLDAYSRFPMFMNVFEPITLLSALAGLTTHIGLGGTASTSFSEPYNIARQFASLDHLSHGRAAWNVVTSANDFAARNFGHEKLPPHGLRYERASEFVDVVQRLWDSWEDDAFIRDRARGQVFDPAKQHVTDHQGRFFKVHGALNIERTPQGQPVIIQAGASDTGRDFAARVAEVVFASDSTVAKAKASYDDLKGRMATFGRERDAMKVLAGKPNLLAHSAQEAEDMYRTLQEMIHPVVGKMRLGMDLEADLSDLDPDLPIPEERIPKSANFHQAYYHHIIELIRQGLTLRQLWQRYERGHETFRGTPQQMADHLEEWFTAEACDGFMMTFSLMPGGLAFFVEHVVPILQRRGLYRTDYAGRTLREHLGLARPANRHAGGGTPARRRAIDPGATANGHQLHGTSSHGDPPMSAAEYEPPKVWTWNKANGGRFANINRPIAGPTHDKELPVGKHPMQLYSLGTPNGVKVTIMLEELLALGHAGAEYDAWLIRIGEGDQFGSGFVAINPNSKIPALLDRSGPAPVRVFESGAILMHLAEKFGAFLPKDGPTRAEVLSWLFWQMGSAPYLGGGFGHFYAYAPTKMEYPIDRFTMEVKRQLDVLDRRLAESDYIAGPEYSIADIAIWPWYGGLVKGWLYGAAEFLDVQSYAHVQRWADRVGERPAVKRGRMVNRMQGDPASQLRERHDAGDFETKTQDKLEPSA